MFRPVIFQRTYDTVIEQVRLFINIELPVEVAVLLIKHGIWSSDSLQLEVLSLQFVLDIDEHIFVVAALFQIYTERPILNLSVDRIHAGKKRFHNTTSSQ